MRTFTESLRFNKTRLILQEAFILMARKGVDPNRFVEWYATDGQVAEDQGLLTEAAVDWLDEELFLVEGALRRWTRGLIGGAGGAVGRNVGRVAGGVAGGVADIAQGGVEGLGQAASETGKGLKQGWDKLRGNDPNAPKPTPAAPAPGSPAAPAAPAAQPQPLEAHMKTAHAALDALSKRIAKNPPLKDRLGGDPFHGMLTQLISTLKDGDPSKVLAAAPAAPPTAPAAATPIPVSPPPPPPAPAPAHSPSTHTPSLESNGFANFTRRIRSVNEIKSGLRGLQQFGINPVKFVEWHLDEGQYLNESEYGDWFGRQFAGIGGLLSKKGWGAAGQEWQQNKDKQRDDGVIQQALKVLTDFGANAGGELNPDFANSLKAVLQGLQKSMEAPAETPADDGSATPSSDPSAAAPPADPLDAHAQQITQMANAATFDKPAFEMLVNTAKTNAVDLKQLFKKLDPAVVQKLKAQGVDFVALGMEDDPHEFDGEHESIQHPRVPLFFEYLKRRA